MRTKFLILITLLLSVVAVPPAHGLREPRDPEFANQWSLQSVNPVAMRAVEAWDPWWRWVANFGDRAFVSAVDNHNQVDWGPREVRASGRGLASTEYHAYAWIPAGTDFTCGDPAYFDLSKFPKNAQVRCEESVGWGQARKNLSDKRFHIPDSGAWMRFTNGEKSIFYWLRMPGDYLCRFWDPLNIIPLEESLNTYCQVQDQPNGSTILADEGGYFTLSEYARVAYVDAQGDRALEAELAPGVRYRCSPETFRTVGDPSLQGDPAFGTRKHCEEIHTMGHKVVMAVLGDGAIRHPDVPLSPPLEVSSVDMVDVSHWDPSDAGTSPGTPFSPGLPSPQPCPPQDPEREKFSEARAKALVTAIPYNGSYGVGIAPDVEVLDVKVNSCVNRGKELPRWVYDKQLANGIRWSAGLPLTYVDAYDVQPATHPARIILVPFAYSGLCPTEVQTAIDLAWEKGAIVVAPVGRSGTTSGGPTPSGKVHYPANCKHVLPVTGVDEAGKMPFDNFGTYANYSSDLPYGIAAPANRIRLVDWELKTAFSGHYKPDTAESPGTDYARYQHHAPSTGQWLNQTWRNSGKNGVSEWGMTAAVTEAGSNLALMLGANPDLTATNLLERGVIATHELPVGGCRNLCGYGVPDAVLAEQVANTRTHEVEPNDTNFFADYVGPPGGDITAQLFNEQATDGGGTCAANLTCFSNPQTRLTHDTDIYVLELQPGQRLDVYTRVQGCNAPTVCRLQIERAISTDEYDISVDDPNRRSLRTTNMVYTNLTGQTQKVRVRVFSQGAVPTAAIDYTLIMGWHSPPPARGWVRGW